MKIRIPFFLIVVMILLVLQSTIFEYLTIFNVKPNLLLVFIICIALYKGSFEGAVAGIIAGFAQDMISGKLIGFYALLGFYTGLLTGYLNKRLYRDNILVPALFIFASTLFYEFSVYLLNALFITGSKVIFIYPVKSIIIPEAFYNSLTVFIIYPLVMRIDKRIDIIMDRYSIH